MNSEIETNGAMGEEAAAEVPQETPAEQEVPAKPEQEDPWAVFREDANDAFSNPFEPKKAESAPAAGEAPVNPAAPQGNVPPYGYAPPQGAAQPQGNIPPYGYVQPQSCTPPQGYAQPQSYAQPQGYAPYGYAPQQGYGQPYGYAPQGYVPYGQVPPQGNVPPRGSAPAQPYNAYSTPVQTAPKKGGAGQVLMWVAAILIEAVIVCFAIYGVYALVTRDNAGPRPGFGQGQQIPSMPDRNDDFGGSSSNGSNPSSEVGENPTNVQMGVVCGQMSENYAEYYGLEVGLVVQSFASDSPAKAAGLQIDDVITSANGIRVKTFEELFAIMQKMKPGDEMKLECYRLVRSEENIWGFKAGEPFTVTFTMQAKHEETSSAPSVPVYPGA